MFIDVHAHLDREGLVERLDEVVKNAEEAGMTKIITAGADLPSSILAVEIANRYPNVYATIGVHPQDAETYSDDTEAKLEELFTCSKVAPLANKVVGFGEIGLDYHYDDGPSREVQKEVFVKQLVLADKLKLPVVLHMRNHPNNEEEFPGAPNATEDMLAILKENKHLLKHGGVMHCFAGDVDTAKEVLELGFVISVGGILTFKKNKLEEVMLAAGLNNIVLETDCPWLAPDPFRGKLNEPKYVPFVAKKLAELFGCSVEEVEMQTTKNAERMFGL